MTIRRNVVRVATIILVAFLCISTTDREGGSLDIWGQDGHRVTAAIAQNHLSKRALRRIDNVLDGESLVTVSTWADEIKSIPAMRKYGPWHYVNVPFDSTYDAHPKSEKGDIVMAIEKCIAVLKGEEQGEETDAFYLKMLVHLVGDIHQPWHTGLQEDKGGNDFQVQWFRKGSNMHRVWDSGIIDRYGMSYSELVTNIPELSKAEAKKIATTDVRVWLVESRELVKGFYKSNKPGNDLGYAYLRVNAPIVRTQLQKGGLRLAAVLEEIY